MKVSCLLVICLNFMSGYAFGQRRIIDVWACRNWTRLEEVNSKACLLSGNGNFAMFKMYSENGGGVTILKNLKFGSESKFGMSYNEDAFDQDKMFSFQIPGDSLVIFDTQRESYTYIPGVKEYFIVRSAEMDMIAYFTERGGGKSLTVWDIKKERRLKLTDVATGKYWFDKWGTALLIAGEKGLIYMDLKEFKPTLLASDTNVEDVALSYRGDEFVYISHETNGYELKYANMRSGERYILLSDSSAYLKDNLRLEPMGLSFDNSEGNVFFKISRISNYYKNKSDSIITRDVDIWSYQDLVLQPKQLSDLWLKLTFTSMINVRSLKIVQIESDELSLEPAGNTDKYFVVTTRINENEFYWNKQKKSMFLVSAITGDKILVKEAQYPGFTVVGVSPDNRFVVWFDGADGNYYSYNIASGKTLNISRCGDGSLSSLNQRGQAAKVINKAYPYEGQYWINGGGALIVGSKNDIWQLDPLGLQGPINLTNGYGNLHDIRFRLVDAGEALIKLNSDFFLVWAFDNRSKQNGFWKICIGKSANPIKLVMSDDAYFFYPNAPLVFANSAENPTRFRPIKALKKNLFVLRRMNSAHAPNLYYTTDFQSFKQLSNINPNKDYGCVSTKLVTWILPDGHQAEGILHRPDNFDSTGKYPIIFNYYERRSECLNIFRTPELSGHNINIPWYISREYLVFEPDFYYKRGETAKSVITSVESAIVELRKIPYIDQNKMGIQGQSHGGYETNILATGTNLFAAACEMAGYTNIISEYGSIRPGGYNNQMAADLDQRNLGVFPWDKPQVFIENSPLFHVSRMNTPLLMVHNKEDGAVLFSQAVELYLAIRRLGKEVWLLQYDGEGHSIVKNENKLDYTIRMQQFFDHYLKGAPEPVWMSKGVPASLKGVVSGLQYEPSLVGQNK